MKKKLIGIAVITALLGCKSTNTTVDTNRSITANLNLVDIRDDKVQVVIDPDVFSLNETVFYLPRIVPGSYAIDDFGKFIEDFVAVDYEGNTMEFEKIDENSWFIPNAKELDKVTYWVNDTYDIEGEGGVFSPLGTNISEGENFMLNLHGFVGYFENHEEDDYILQIKRSESLIPGTALRNIDSKKTKGVVMDVFSVDRYFQVSDNPIMYSRPDTAKAFVEGVELLFNVHSPNKVTSAKKLMPGVEKMIRAQKNFLGEIDNTSKYAILLYLSDKTKPDASGTGALEHHTSTVVNLPETMAPRKMKEVMTDIVSHEFFHILTPLNVHSNEIHYFDYNEPEMSEHLWMYEGVTEYFANLFQVNQELISEENFYERIMEKIRTSKRFNDTMPFTIMSENILQDEFKDSFYNVYQKGALIGMALDIRLRELSDGESGLLDLMKRLSSKYGKNNPFEDEDLIGEIVDMTHPEIQDFFDTYVSGTTPIPYDDFFNKVGLRKIQVEKETGYFKNGNMPYINAEIGSEELFFIKGISYNSFLRELGVQGGDIIISINGTKYGLPNVEDLFVDSKGWEEGEKISMTVERNGKEITLEGKAFQPKMKTMALTEDDSFQSIRKSELRKAWLKK
ncbi:MAG: peptidase M61 [Bacteroidota bacterium]